MARKSKLSVRERPLLEASSFVPLFQGLSPQWPSFISLLLRIGNHLLSENSVFPAYQQRHMLHLKKANKGVDSLAYFKSFPGYLVFTRKWKLLFSLWSTNHLTGYWKETLLSLKFSTETITIAKAQRLATISLCWGWIQQAEPDNSESLQPRAPAEARADGVRQPCHSSGQHRAPSREQGSESLLLLLQTPFTFS